MEREMKASTMVSIVGIISMVLAISSCVTISNKRLAVDQDYFEKNYSTIKNIIIEEAANNGYGQLTSEVKPSEFNNWEGQLYFLVTTGHGRDQFTVEFERSGKTVGVYMHGAGAKANPKSASAAITSRMKQLR